MFSGIIESCEKISHVEPLDQALRIWIQRPPHFDDLKVGDSIAVNGVCLTLEANKENPSANVTQLPLLQFTVGFETLSVLQRKETKDWLGRSVNLERSLRFGDRIHGHFVTGHVEAMGIIKESYAQGENWMIAVQIPKSLKPYCWSKGSLTVNGTSLTINNVNSETLTVEHCLIPETQLRTNLSMLKVGDTVCLETDSMVRGLFEGLKNGLFKELSNIKFTTES